jgi:hypothetical protein
MNAMEDLLPFKDVVPDHDFLVSNGIFAARTADSISSKV